MNSDNLPLFLPRRGRVARDEGGSEEGEGGEEDDEGFPKAQLFWVIGADQLPKLNTWERYEELKKQVRFVVMSRPFHVKVKEAPFLIDLPRPRLIDISATEIRERVQNKLSIDHLVPSPVARYIKKMGLYK